MREKDERTDRREFFRSLARAALAATMMGGAVVMASRGKIVLSSRDADNVCVLCPLRFQCDARKKSACPRRRHPANERAERGGDQETQ